jgi:two-component system, OmpR family, osmolarity sensor histidine kinase EnvZ
MASTDRIGGWSHWPSQISLFWRTYLLLAALVAGSVVAWLQATQSLAVSPRNTHIARQVATLVGLVQSSLDVSDEATRARLVRNWAEQEHLQVLHRAPNDRFGPPPADAPSERIAAELARHHKTWKAAQPTSATPNASPPLLTHQVNGEAGLWVGFSAAGAPYWLRIDPRRLSPDEPSPSITWLTWLALAVLLSMTGAALLTRLVTQPIHELWLAASRVQGGDYDSSQLDEKASNHEVREVNIGFNRMTARIAKMDQDRAVMLAGISHDLRTPLTRLRIETELSVPDEAARAHMSNDIEQLDRTIDKFLDYARPIPAHFKTVDLQEVIEACLYALSAPSDLQVTVDLTKGLKVVGDATELTRVISNLLENARKYGRTPETGVAEVSVTARRRDHWVVLRVRDKGPGVAEELLPKMTQAFFRGDAARSSATGAGLGLSIVEKTIQRMGGTVSVKNSSRGGLAVTLRLNKAS